MVESSRRTIGEYDLILHAGEGSFGEVWYAYDMVQTKFVAIKGLDKYHIIKNNKIKHVIREKDILSKFDHPNIIKLESTFQVRSPS